MFEFQILLIWYYYFFNLKSKWQYTLHSWRKHSLKWTTFDTFLRRVSFIWIFLQEELASLLNARKPFSGNLEGWKVKIFPSAWTMVTILTILVNLCPVKIFFLISTPASLYFLAWHGICWFWIVRLFSGTFYVRGRKGIRLVALLYTE